MKTLGLLGGMSWESTLTYYKIINETVQAELSGLHSAKILLYSVDFDEIERLQSAGRWDDCAAILTDAAKRLEAAGADFLVICTNTLHKVAPEIQARVSIPLLHIAKATARELRKAGVSAVGLLGTSYTLTQDFYTEVLRTAGLDVLIPEDEAIRTLDAIIFGELCRGNVREESGQEILRMIERLKSRGAQGVVLGCTELGLLVRPGDVEIPVFDTALIHAQAAALASLRDSF